MIMPLSGLWSLASGKNLARSVSLSFALGLWLHWHICLLTWENSDDVRYGFQAFVQGFRH